MSTHTADAVDLGAIDRTRWRIDPAGSSIKFRVKNFWGMATVEGRFTRYHGTLDLSARRAVALAVETASLDTANEKRDAHLGGPEFFDADNHPYVRVVSESATLDGERLHVRGRLHARGRSVPLELTATVRRVGADVEVQAATEVDHRELGMTWNLIGMVRPKSKLLVTARLVRDAV
jgi:polyisoprenoid-binding protein YceI